jgi:hypothetical protein
MILTNMKSSPIQLQRCKLSPVVSGYNKNYDFMENLSAGSSSHGSRSTWMAHFNELWARSARERNVAPRGCRVIHELFDVI